MPFSDFATLVLNQFDLSFQVTDRKLTLVDLPAVIEVKKRHPFPSRERSTIEARCKDALPDLDVTWSRASVTASATVEVHERLERLIRGGSRETVAAATLRDRKMTFKVPPGTQMGSVIVSFRRQGIPIEIAGLSDEELTRLLGETVNFDLKSVPAEDFFRAIFKSWNAEVDVQDNRVVVRFGRKLSQ